MKAAGLIIALGILVTGADMACSRTQMTPSIERNDYGKGKKVEELDVEMQRAAEETWLNTRQVRELLNVCEGTLNLWAKRGYLVPVKVGNKN